MNGETSEFPRFIIQDYLETNINIGRSFILDDFITTKDLKGTQQADRITKNKKEENKAK